MTGALSLSLHFYYSLSVDTLAIWPTKQREGSRQCLDVVLHQTHIRKKGHINSNNYSNVIQLSDLSAAKQAASSAPSFRVTLI